jgi:predicted nucleic acid-binding protein
VSGVRKREDPRDDADPRIARDSHEHWLERIWKLRHNCTAYDAANLALAEELDCPLITCDKPLAAMPGHRVTIELFSG